MQHRDVLRSALFFVGLALPVTLDCIPGVPVCTDCTSYGIYSLETACTAFDWTLGPASGDWLAASGCEPVDRSASGAIGGTSARVSIETSGSEGGVSVACRFEADADLAEPLRCEGVFEARALFLYVAGDDAGRWEVQAFTTASAEAGDAGSSDPRVRIDCPGILDDTAVPLDGNPLELPNVPLRNFACDVTIEMASAVIAAGDTFHSVSVVFRQTEGGCASAHGCPDDERCVSGVCVSGSEGDPCRSSYIEGVGGDCGRLAPFCVETPLSSTSSCQDGSLDDPCATASQCAPGLFCVEVRLDEAFCKDGSPGEVCSDDTQCEPGCSCIGLCVGACADPGSRWSSCTDPSQCDTPLGCHGFYGYCGGCVLDDDCQPGFLCDFFAQECVPES